jgi:Tol biopolymer transport system component
MKKIYPCFFAILLLFGLDIQQTRERYDFICIYNVDLYAGRWGTSEKTFLKTMVNHAAIAPDGKKCAYVRYDENGNPSIYILDLFTRNEYKVKTGLKNNYQPVWSADNVHVAFNAWNEEYNYMALVHTTTHKVTVLDKEKMYSGREIYGPNWTKDGKYIIYDDRKEVFLCDKTGKRVEKIELTDSVRLRLKSNTKFMLTADKRYLVYDAESAPTKRNADYIPGVFAFNTRTKQVKQLTRKYDRHYLSWLTAENEVFYTGYDLAKREPIIYKISINDTSKRIQFDKMNEVITRN